MSSLPSTAVIGIIGAGAMGSGIAQVAATAGHEVLLFDVVASAAEKGIEGIGRLLERQVAKGKMPEKNKQQILDRLQPCSSLQDFAGSDLVIEAIVEDLDKKQELFSALEKIVRPDCVLATNTSSLSITAIGSSLKHSDRFVGMHFFNPAVLMALVEVVSGLGTSKEVAQKVSDTAEKWGKIPVHAKSTPGFIVNRVARPFYAEGLRILEEGGADVPTIDSVLREAGGFRMGAFELMDLIGHDVNFAVTCSVYKAYFYDPRFLPSLIQQEMVSAGYLGRKSSRGFYVYGEDTQLSVPSTAEPVSFSHEVVVEGSLGVAEGLIDRIEKSGIKIKRQNQYITNGGLVVGPATLRLTDGRMATQCAAEEGYENLVLFDLALDYSNASRIAIVPADQCSDEAFNVAIGFFQELGMQVSILDDCPGLIVMRTVAMLANESADAVNQNVCSAAAVDTAMLKGVNYPKGPLAWADSIGPDHVLRVLDNLAATYGEDRYRASVLLRRKAYSGRMLND